MTKTMNISNSIRIGRFHTLLLGFTFAIFSIAAGTIARAQHGINSEGTDFFVGLMPGIAPTSPYSIHGHQYILISSLFNNNSVHIDYFAPNVTNLSTGSHELGGSTHVLNKGMSLQFMIDTASMAPSYPGEVAEYKACHIHSTYPVSVQVYTDGSNNGSLYQAIPTAALGKNYVVAAYNDNPDDPGFVTHDSSSSEFMIIAPYDSTTVTFVPNSTTKSGVVGVNSGAGANGSPHPVSILLNRGQIYWVRSSCQDISQDESGSTVVANKPVAVLGGQERAMIGYPYGYWTGLTLDIRNELVQEMTPVADWGTDYPSIPTMPASSTDVTIAGDGDMYRVFTDDPKGMTMNYWQNPSDQWGPNHVGLYGLPAMQFDNITDPIDLLTDANSLDVSGNLKKFCAVQYTYFQGSGSALQETSYRSESEIDLVPIDHWKMSTAFMVPFNSIYNGYQFINIITNKDSLKNIFIWKNGVSPSALQSYDALERYTIPRHPELVGLTFKLSSASYIISGNTPFVCYSYGRTETLDNDIWGYGAPTGQSYGSHAQPNPPQATITPSCGEWNVLLHEGGTGGGIADVKLLNDPDGFVTRPAYVSRNCRMYPNDPTLPPFEVGQTSLDVQIQVDNPNDSAFAALFVVDCSGNDTVILLHYLPPRVSLSQKRVSFPDVLVTKLESSTVTFHVTATGSTDSLYVTPAKWAGHDTTGSLSLTTVPTLPAWLKAGDSVVFNISYVASDTNVHFDTILLTTSCIDDSIGIIGRGRTPIIIADDIDFGNVRIGDTVCRDLRVRNVGNANLILDENWVFGQNPDFTFEGGVPDTIKPDGAVNTLRFCFHPSHAGPNTSEMSWGTNIKGIYEHQIKDTSLLIGYGIASDVASAPSQPKAALSILPNPTSGIASISLAGAPEATVEIFDILGREVASFRVTGSYVWNMAGLPAGTYIVRAEVDGEVISKRILKQ